jgi:hypothetical protein
MSEPEHDFKEKSKRRTKTSAIDFVIPLQLELCLHRIAITPAQRELQITVQADENRQTADEVELLVFFRPEGADQLKAEGKLRRWEGTSTRFEGKLTAPVWNPRVLIILMLITVLYPIPACLISYLLFASTVDAMYSAEACVFLMITWGLPYLLILGLMSIWSDRVTYREFREALEAHVRVKSKS